ncbi:MAG: hypothetical protein ACTSP0_06830, partial [Alphaproteobacteria bacterium]
LQQKCRALRAFYPGHGGSSGLGFLGCDSWYMRGDAMRIVVTHSSSRRGAQVLSRWMRGSVAPANPQYQTFTPPSD